ncbi:MAG: hypothetical protein EKK40_16155 [Bradyrhizobiaceae bacterium]|nr:MAG: hypothetical protein EKK40_16155 [Bradyrhizobiaceae bacterium]
MRGLLGVIILAVLAYTASALAQNADSRAEIIEEHRCHLAGNLRAVYRSSQDRARYVTLSRPGQLNSYVQCGFIEARSKLHCEASSSYYSQSEIPPRLIYPSAEEKNALEKLGFKSGNGLENFSYKRDLTSAPDFDGIARLMLLAMHDGFGARAETYLELRAEFDGTLITACRH